MNWLNKKFLSWALMLIMVFSSVQAAVTVEQLNHVVKCPMATMSVAQLIDGHSTDQFKQHLLTRKCDMGHGDSCQSHPQCTGQINLSSLLGSDPDQLASRILIRNKLITSDELVLTIYPSCLKRPPKA